MKHLSFWWTVKSPYTLEVEIDRLWRKSEMRSLETFLLGVWGLEIEGARELLPVSAWSKLEKVDPGWRSSRKAQGGRAAVGTWSSEASAQGCLLSPRAAVGTWRGEASAQGVSSPHVHLRGPAKPWGPSEGMFSLGLSSGSRSSSLSSGEQCCSQTTWAFLHSTSRHFGRAFSVTPLWLCRKEWCGPAAITFQCPGTGVTALWNPPGVEHRGACWWWREPRTGEDISALPVTGGGLAADPWAWSLRVRARVGKEPTTDGAPSHAGRHPCHLAAFLSERLGTRRGWGCRHLAGWCCTARVYPPSLLGPSGLTPRLRLQTAGSFQRRLYKLGVHDRALLGREGRGGMDAGNPRHAIPGPQPGEARSVAPGMVPAPPVFQPCG